MKDKLFIFGDSFSVSNPGSWVSKLDNNFDIINFSSNGSSEYRIFKSFQNNRKLVEGHKVLFCHTSPTRIYLKNDVLMSSRQLHTHPFCDLIFADIKAKKEIKFIKVLENIWDEEFFNDIYNLMFFQMQIKNSTHITFFDLNHCYSLYNIWQNNPGKVNHLNIQGNILIYETVKELLK